MLVLRRLQLLILIASTVRLVVLLHNANEFAMNFMPSSSVACRTASAPPCAFTAWPRISTATSVSNARMLRRHISQRNVLLQERRVRTAGDVADFLPALVEDLVAVARDAALDHLQADERALHARGFGFLQRVASDEVALLHLEEAVEPGLPDIDLSEISWP